MERIVPVVLSLIIAGLVIGAGSLVLQKFGDKLQTSSAFIVLDEQGNGSTHAFLNGSGYFIAARSNETYVGFVIDALYNTTSANDNTLLDSTNYTTTSATGQIINASLVIYANISVNYTYTINNNPNELQATRNASLGILEIASFLPTIGIILGAMLIIGLIVIRKSSFGLR